MDAFIKLAVDVQSARPVKVSHSATVAVTWDRRGGDDLCVDPLVGAPPGVQREAVDRGLQVAKVASRVSA
jgi:hypothetical protein